MSIREIIQSPVTQGVEESIVYTLTTTPWGSSPASVSVKVYRLASSGTTDVTSTVMPTNTPTVSGDVITLSPLTSLIENASYRVEIKFTCSGNIFEAFCIVNAEN